MCDCVAILCSDDPRAPSWTTILQSEKLELPLKSPIRLQTKLGVMLQGDITRFSQDQLTRLIDYLSETFDVTKAAILADLQKGIFPILDQNITISICRSHALAML